VYFASPLKGFPWELGIGARGQTTSIVALPEQEKSLTISSAVWIQYTIVTDRRPPDDSKDRAYA